MVGGRGRWGGGISRRPPPPEFLQTWDLDKPFPASHLRQAFLKTWALLLPCPVPTLGPAKD